MQRSRLAATSRAAAFLVVCSPLWLMPRAAWIAFPFALPVVLGVTLLFLRWDRRPAAALGLDLSRRRVAELAGGAVAGAMLVAAIAAIVAAALPFPWVRNPRFDAVQALFSIGSLLYGNAVEELIFRGYGFERLIAGIGHWQAQLATALLFAVFHVANGWPWQAALAGTTVGSLLFGLVFVRWRSVPAAVGVHAVANWTRDLLLSDPPGQATFIGPLAPRPWTGGEQAAALLIWNGVILVTCGLLWRAIRQRDVLSRPIPAPGDGDREGGR
jgi:membrane protease YdiL (CAAX protease family)